MKPLNNGDYVIDVLPILQVENRLVAVIPFDANNWIIPTIIAAQARSKLSYMARTSPPRDQLPSPEDCQIRKIYVAELHVAELHVVLLSLSSCAR